MLSVGDIVSEAFERIGVDPSSTQHQHLVSARRSLQLLFVELYASAFNETDYIDLVRTQVGIGQRVIVLSDDTLDVLDVASISSAGYPFPLSRMSRQDELYQPSSKGQPTAYWIAKTAITDLDLQEQPTGGLGSGGFGYGTIGGSSLSPGGPALSSGSLMILWPAPEAVTTIAYNRLRIPAAITANLAASPDARGIWTEAICAGLAWKLSMKYAPERAPLLKGEWLESRSMARIESRERAPVVISVHGFGRSRRRRG